MLRPFKVGDYVVAGEIEGTVQMLGLFSTTIDTPDNVQTMVGNAKIMNGTIKNFSSNPYRRVDLVAQIDHSVDPGDAIRRLKDALPTIANVVADPKPDVEILTFTDHGPESLKRSKKARRSIRPSEPADWHSRHHLRCCHFSTSMSKSGSATIAAYRLRRSGLHDDFHATALFYRGADSVRFVG